jgi:hypothetical protein
MEAQTASSAYGGYSQALAWGSAICVRWLHVNASLVQAVCSVILSARPDVIRSLRLFHSWLQRLTKRLGLTTGASRPVSTRD